MSSLWTLVRKRQSIGYDPEHWSQHDADQLFPKVLRAQPRLINIHEQAEQWFADAEDRTIVERELSSFDATPCFPCLWMEWIPREVRHGVLIWRSDITPEVVEAIRASKRSMALPSEDSKYRVQMLVFSEFDAAPQFHGLIDFCINALGQPRDIGIAGSKSHHPVLSAYGLLCCDILTTINTSGTRIEPPFDSPQAQIVKPNRAPCSVWHTIRIPKFHNPPLAGAVISPEVLERREHWVRAHRRDYRHGNGMFGRIKSLVWVPEFQRGNGELGTVKQTYVVGR